MPLLSDRLPTYSGPYEVGTLDIEAPCEKRVVANANLIDTGKPAFELDTVLFSLYYPTVKEVRTLKPAHRWVENLKSHARGYARFAHMDNFIGQHLMHLGLWTFVGNTEIPAFVDVPLNGARETYGYPTEQPLNKEGLPEFPVIVFSHGMAASRTSYTQWCGEMASRGFIVAAIEHRDGSGPGTAVIYKNGPSREVLSLSHSGLEHQPDTDDFKHMQLAMRQAEIEETVRVLGLINAGFGEEVYSTNARNEGSELSQWQGRLNMNRFVAAGHSFGAVAALQVLAGGPSEKFPFVGAIVLDPGKQSGPLNDDVEVPLLVVHSQSWSARHTIFQGRNHFDVVKDLVKKVMEKNEHKKSHFAWFMTAKGTTHPSVTDAPLIEPILLSWTTGSTIDAREGVVQYVKVSEEFMRYLDDGHRIGILAEEVTHPTYGEDISSEKRMQEMSKDIAKYWEIHVAPSTFCPFPGMCGVQPET